MTNTLEFITTTTKVTVKKPCGCTVAMSYTHYTKRVITVSSPEKIKEVENVRMLGLVSV